MSPKSRGRAKKPSRGRAAGRRRNPGVLDQLIRDAASLVREEDAVLAESWASDWLGQLWSAAEEEGGDAEVGLCRMLADRVSQRPSAAGLAAVHAFARVAPPRAQPPLAAAISAASETFPTPAFTVTAPPKPARAWTAVDVWGAERMIFVEYETPEPHTLVAQVLDAGGRLVETLVLVVGGDVAAEWEQHRTDDDVPMPVEELPVETVLADLADAMASTDAMVPAQDEENFVSLRALVWSRVRDYDQHRPEREPMSEAEVDELVSRFVASADVPRDAVTLSLVGTFIAFDEGYLPAPLAWSPIAVRMFLDHTLTELPHVDDDERAALPDVLRRWVRFALEARGVPERWIEPAVAAVTNDASAGASDA